MAVKAQKSRQSQVPEPVEGPVLIAKKPPNSTPEKESSTVRGREAFIHVFNVAIVLLSQNFQNLQNHFCDGKSPTGSFPAHPSDAISLNILIIPNVIYRATGVGISNGKQLRAFALPT